MSICGNLICAIERNFSDFIVLSLFPQISCLKSIFLSNLICLEIEELKALMTSLTCGQVSISTLYVQGWALIS